MSDLVERLRTRPTGDPYLHMLVHEAADEITRLRAEVQAKENRITGLVNLLQSVSAAGVASRAEVEALRADAERWRYASNSLNFGISFWGEFGNGTCYGELAAERVDTARKA